MITVFIDGACTENGKPGARAAYGVHFPDIEGVDKSALLPEEEKQTNQRAELHALIDSFILTREMGNPIHIVSDSQYCIKILTEWMDGWLKKGIVKENWDLIMALNEARKDRVFTIEHVKSHQKIKPGMTDREMFLIRGNSKADQLATSSLIAEKTEEIC